MMSLSVGFSWKAPAAMNKMFFVLTGFSVPISVSSSMPMSSSWSSLPNEWCSSSSVSLSISSRKMMA